MKHDEAQAATEAAYEEVADIVKGIIESNARRFARQLNLSVDEARQEARLALVLGLRDYDYNKSRGGIYNYVSKCVRRHFLKLWATFKTQSRRPTVHVLDDNGKPLVKDGKLVTKPVAFAELGPRGIARSEHEGDFMDVYTADEAAPDSELEAADADHVSSAFIASLENALTERDREVLRCKIDPPRGLRMLMLDELTEQPTIPLIGRYLGLSKNEVDWAIKRIRQAAVKVIETEFSDVADLALFRRYVES